MISKSQYYIRRNGGDQQAVVLYDDGSTVIWDRIDGRLISSSGDHFDDYCNEFERNGFDHDDGPGWEAPAKELYL